MAREQDTFLPDQFSNPANPEVHRRTTGPEIERALEGTGGRAGRRGRNRGHDHGRRRVSARAQPRICGRGGGAAGLGGAFGRAAGPHRIQGIGAGFVPPVLNRDLLDEVVTVTDDDAIQTAWSCARRVGLLAGISCGAALWASLQVAARPESRDKRIVVIMPDSGERYVSQAFFAP